MNSKPLTKKEIFNLLKKISLDSLKSEKINLLNSEGRILSSDIKSLIDLPPFNNSAVDGYAIRKENLKNYQILKCKHRLAAGDKKTVSLNLNEVARIFTGARMPFNSNTVVMQENVKLNDKDHIYIKKMPKEGDNCRLAGEDVKKNSIIFKSGEKINSININLIAAIGKSHIKVKEKLKVGYFTSGNELKNLSEKLSNSEINNSNHYSLLSLLNKNYLEPKYLGVLKDKKQLIINSILKNLAKYHVIITTGGASVGDEDHIINILKEKGELFFWKIAIKPGRPLAIGKIKDTIFICLPGNPVSVHLLYGMIIKPFLEFLCGSKMIIPKSLKATVNFSMKKKTYRLEWLRVKINKKNTDGLFVDKYPKQGSGIISSISYSDGIIEIPENVSQINIGDKFDFYQFDQLFF